MREPMELTTPSGDVLAVNWRNVRAVVLPRDKAACDGATIAWNDSKTTRVVEQFEDIAREMRRGCPAGS